GAALAAAWPGARMSSTEGLGHHRLLRSEAVAATACRFVSEPPASGGPEPPLAPSDPRRLAVN
ncbi:MAG: hypothetical protein MI919_33245, partial [Holophagales bacterium]|nr:hypothetical protein [Holophagales bacterium]